MLISKYRIVRRTELATRTIYILKSADKRGHVIPYPVHHASAEGREFNRRAEIGACVFIQVRHEK